MPTFKVQGQVYHLIGNLLTAEGAQPIFANIFCFSCRSSILAFEFKPDLVNRSYRQFGKISPRS